MNFFCFCFVFLALWSNRNERSGVPYVPLKKERKLQYFKYSQRQPYTQLIIHKLTLRVEINAFHSLNIGFDPVFVVSAYFRSCTFYLKRISLQTHTTFSEWQPA